MNIVDLRFPVSGSQVPRDHGYLLYSALSRLVPDLHGADWLGIQPLSGMPLSPGYLALRDDAALWLRLPVDRIAIALSLSGKQVVIRSCSIRLGAPSVAALQPTLSLDARIVVFHLTQNPWGKDSEGGERKLHPDVLKQGYVSRISETLEQLEIKADFKLLGRQCIEVRGRRLLGYSVRVSNLSAEESVRLQEIGLGGKRRFGCGIFRATRGKVSD